MMEEEKNKSKKSIYLAENNNNNINNLISMNSKINENEIEEKLEIINKDQNDKNNDCLKKEIKCINDTAKKYLPIPIINNEFDFKYDISLNQILPVGLKNLGKSCFMNSCLQCFYHCSKFTSELLENHLEYEKMKCPVLLGYLEAIKSLYTNGKEYSKRKVFRLSNGNINKEYDNGCCCCKKGQIRENNKVIYYTNDTNPISAIELYSYILNNYSNLSNNNGNDPKIVAEMILSTMNKEIDSNFRYIRDRKISKNDEALLFAHIFNYYKNNKTIISSNFYWIKERVSICNDCGKETYNFQSDYILYFYPEAIINGLNLKTYDNEYKYKLSLENCFEYFHNSEQLDVNLFTCNYCNKRVKAKSILDYMATLPKYLVVCLCKDKDNENPINYIFDYNQEIDLGKYYKKHPQNHDYSTKYKFHSGSFLNHKDTHIFAFCVHFDGAFYKFDDSIYKKYNYFQDCISKFHSPYLLIYRRDDIDI